MSEELKPCPFCGGKAILQQYDGGGVEPSSAIIDCASCNMASTEWYPSATLERSLANVAQLWNTRPEPIAVEQKYGLDAIEDMLAEFSDQPEQCLAIIGEWIGRCRHNARLRPTTQATCNDTLPAAQEAARGVETLLWRVRELEAENARLQESIRCMSQVFDNLAIELEVEDAQNAGDVDLLFEAITRYQQALLAIEASNDGGRAENPWTKTWELCASIASDAIANNKQGESHD